MRDDHPRLPRSYHGPAPGQTGAPAPYPDTRVEEPAGVLADELDQRGDPQRLPDVVHVHDKHGNADQHEHEAVTTAMPGTLPDRRRCSSPRASARIACTKVATNRPIANWLGLSLNILCTIRGENWPIASWTTTIVIVNTSAAR